MRATPTKSRSAYGMAETANDQAANHFPVSLCWSRLRPERMAEINEATDLLGQLADEDVEAAPSAVNVPAERSGDVARSGLYALFAQLFAFPKLDTVKLLASADWSAQLAELTEQLPYALAAGDSAVVYEEREVSLTFSRLFDVVHGLPALSLLERRYGENKVQKKLWEDLLRYYNHFGLEFSHAAAEGGPDHLVNELEFMHYLSFLQCGNGDAGGDFRRAQRDFLTQHLGQWSGEFAQRAAELADSQPYKSLAGLLAAFVEADLNYLESQLDAFK
ncbi:MAG: hypothetical protein DRQ60_07730 [Gammaproteobacteria bacterium]|nr:MAG: hypothetical protein DRQ60_07730 [Gammaproteobacteria bacterium]